MIMTIQLIRLTSKWSNLLQIIAQSYWFCTNFTNLCFLTINLLTSNVDSFLIYNLQDRTIEIK
jgi:hypothetical protein